jgi:transcriptional regulator with XRE-family HTH domain
MQLPDDDFGKRLRKIRVAKKMKQYELSEAMGVSPRVIGSWENNINRPNIDNLISLCKVLDVDVNSLLGYDSTGDDLSADDRAFCSRMHSLDDKSQQLLHKILEDQEELAAAAHDEADMRRGKGPNGRI